MTICGELKTLALGFAGALAFMLCLFLWVVERVWRKDRGEE